MALSPAVGRPYTPPLDHINWWEEDKHGNNKWKNTTVETIKFIHRENPAYVKTKDRGFGRLPLHRAIVGSAEASVIMEIYQLYPHAIRHKDKNGYLPIHWAAERDRKDLILFLYENYRLGLLEEDRMTNTPMELALRFNKKGAYTLTERFLNSMIVDGGVEFQAYKQKNGLGEKNEAVGSEHGGGSDDPAQTVRETEILQLPPLNKVQMPKKERERRKRSLEKKLLKQYKVSRKARAIIEKYQVDNLYCNTLSKEFFQRSRWVHTTVNTVERLNREKPRHVYTENSLGLVPLNYAVANGAPIGVVKALYGMYIGAVKHRDNNREIALHDAARNNSPAEVITFLTDIYPEGLTVQNKQDHTPYDIAKKGKCKLALELLLRIEDNLKATDEAAWKMYAQRNKGQIESLYSKNASRWEYSSIKHIRELHKKNPHHIRTPDISDNRKWLPLGYAIRSDASKDVVKHLYDLHPDSIKYKGAYGSLPLHIAADYNRIRHIPYLAQKYPISLHEKDIEGKTPLKRAILHDNDVAAEILTKLELKYKKKLDEHKLKLSTEELKIRKRYSLIAHEIDDLSSTSDKWKKVSKITTIAIFNSLLTLNLLPTDN